MGAPLLKADMEFAREFCVFMAPVDAMEELRDEVELAVLGTKALDRRRNIPAPAEAKLALRCGMVDLKSRGEFGWPFVSMSQKTPFKPVTAETMAALTVL